MSIPVLVAKFLVGGILVCVFAFISDVFMPKRFSGIFSSAPSVLVAGLAVTLIADGASKAQLTAEGAIAGAIGMIAFCLVAVPAIRRLKAMKGSLVALAVWCAVAFAAFSAIGRLTGW